MSYETEEDEDGITSEEIWSAIEEAISKVLADHGGGMIEACLGMVDYVGADGYHRFSVFAKEDQFQIHSMSLAQFMYARESEIQRLCIHNDLYADEDDEE